MQSSMVRRVKGPSVTSCQPWRGTEGVSVVGRVDAMGVEGHHAPPGTSCCADVLDKHHWRHVCRGAKRPTSLAQVFAQD